jgi:EamA-like transporter family.
MPRLAILLWVANVALDTTGRIAFKAAAMGGHGLKEEPSVRWSRMMRSLPLWIGVLCFVFEFVAWLALLSLIPLSQAILIGSINIVTVAMAGRILFGERLRPVRFAGIVLIAIGVALAGGLG